MANTLVAKKTETSSKNQFSLFISTEGVKNLVKNAVKDEKGFISSIVSAVATNPKLAECEHKSVLSAALLGASLNLQMSPTLGQFYFIPFEDKKQSRELGRKVMLAQFILGYKGLLQLAIRSGFYKRINVLAIKEGEFISYNPLTEDFQAKMITDDSEREKAETIGYYAMFEYLNGFTKSLYWSKKKMEGHADKYSKAFNLADFAKLKAGKINQEDMWKFSSFWYQDFDGMGLKTMLRQILSKWGILSVELQKAIETDEKIIDTTGETISVEKEDEIPFGEDKKEEVKKEEAVDPLA